MKKLFTCALALLMLFALAACGGKKEPAPQPKDSAAPATSKPASGGEPSDSAPSSGLSQAELDEADEAWDKLMAMTYAADWKWDKEDDSGYINGTWDTEVMYDPVPAPPADINVVEMQFNGKKSTRYGGETASIGNMYIDSTEYEQIWVNFNCSIAQRDQLVQSFIDAGWLMYEDLSMNREDYWHFCYGNEYYAFLRAGDWLADDGYEIGAYLNVLPAYYPLPKSVADVPLPQVGVLMGEGWIDGYDADYNMLESEDGIPLDTPANKMPTYWLYYNESYDGVSVADIQAYRDQLVADGWEVSYEYANTADDYDPLGYNVTLRKGDVRVVCGGNYGYSLSLSISNSDDLYY